MTRAVRVIGTLVALLAVWLSVVTHTLDTRRFLSAQQLDVVQLLPLWALITFGCYSLCSIGCALLTFRDCPEAFKELEVDIASARKSLQKRGFKFDS